MLLATKWPPQGLWVLMIQPIKKVERKKKKKRVGRDSNIVQFLRFARRAGAVYMPWQWAQVGSAYHQAHHSGSTWPLMGQWPKELGSQSTKEPGTCNLECLCACMHNMHTCALVFKNCLGCLKQNVDMPGLPFFDQSSFSHLTPINYYSIEFYTLWIEYTWNCLNLDSAPQNIG